VRGRRPPLVVLFITKEDGVPVGTPVEVLGGWYGKLGKNNLPV